MTKLERLRLQHSVHATLGGRVRFKWKNEEKTGIIVGVTASLDLRVHVDGSPKNEIYVVHPNFEVTYLDDDKWH